MEVTADLPPGATQSGPSPSSPCNNASTTIGLVERLTAMEAMLVGFSSEMDVLRRTVRKEIKNLKKEAGGIEQQAKPKKQKKKKALKKDMASLSRNLLDSELTAMAAGTLTPSQDPSVSRSTSASAPSSAYDPEAPASLEQVEAALRKQSESQQQQLNEYLASFGQRLEEERKRRKQESERRYGRIDQLERELKALRENVLQTLAMDARKVELIQKREIRIRELESLLKSEEEKEQQLLAKQQQKLKQQEQQPQQVRSSIDHAQVS